MTEETRELQKKQLATKIKKHLKKNCSYAFRCVNIDGVKCYPVIHKYKKIINIESIHVAYFNKNNNNSSPEKYSLYFTHYDNIEGAIEKIERIVKTFKLYDGDLVSSNEYENLKLEEVFVPYNEAQQCCVCYENTMEITLCDHYICFKCRETCIMKDQCDCPMCRKPDVLKYFNIDNGLINNVQHKDLKRALEIERCEDLENHSDYNYNEYHDVESDNEIESTEPRYFASRYLLSLSSPHRNVTIRNDSVRGNTVFPFPDINETVDLTQDEHNNNLDTSNFVPLDLSQSFDASVITNNANDSEEGEVYEDESQNYWAITMEEERQLNEAADALRVVM